jgi:GT2 family glycosyltransferase
MIKPVADSEISPDSPFLTGAVFVGVQSVLYNNNPGAVRRAVTSLSRSAELGLHAGVLSRVSLYLGDSSPLPCLSQAQVQEMQSDTLTINYDPFGANLGSAKGHNRLAQINDAEFMVIQNPDVVVSPRTLEILAGAFRTPGIGMAEAKQLPIEHPKDYDPLTGETSWAATACVMFPAALFHKIGGFDADSFFLYCDDLDFSWRVRLSGYKVIFQPAATVFHDKRLSVEGKWMPSAAESYYSSEAALFLAHKWSRPDLVEGYLKIFERSDDENLRKAHDVFIDRRLSGTLPPPLDPEHKIALFINGAYAKHRFAL